MPTRPQTVADTPFNGPRVLIIVTTDPRTSGRPAEAVRLAAGVGAWQKVKLSLYLRDAAVLALGEAAEDLVDGDNFVRYLPAIIQHGHELYAQRASTFLAGLGETNVTFSLIDDTRLAELAGTSRYVLSL